MSALRQATPRRHQIDWIYAPHLRSVKGAAASSRIGSRYVLMDGWREERRVDRRDLIEQRVARLADDFGHYVQVYDRQVSFTSEQLAAHRACIALRRQAGSVRAA